ncbi:MAG TPA: flagellar biosynthetic protein FliO [Rhodocyclaceae bacterium]
MHPLRAILLAIPAASTSALAQNPSVPGVGTESFIQGFVGLAVIVGLILAAAWLLRRFNVVGVTAGAAGMKIIAGLSVGPRERILLLEIGEHWIVVGVTSTQMRTLHTLPKGKLPNGDGTGAPNPAAFSRLLDQFRRRDGA